MDSWIKVRLSDIATTRNGAGVKQENFAKSGIPLARVSDFTAGTISLDKCLFVDKEHAKRWSNHILHENDVVVATVGSWPPNWSSVVGKVVRVTTKSVGAIQNQNTCSVRAIPEFSDQQFLFYLLGTKDFLLYAANSAGGSASQARLPVRSLENYSFLLPPLDEQRRIAHVLGALDDKIELNRQLNGTLEQLARTLFQSWFVDFDPVRAKSSGEPEDSICRRLGLTPELLALFPSALENSVIGEIPLGWKTKKVDELAVINNWTLSKQNSLKHIDYVEISEVNRGNVGSIMRYEPGQEPSRAKRRVKHGDTIISTVRPDRGAYFLCLEPAPELIVSTGFAVISPKHAPWSFIYSALTSDNMLQYLGLIADGAAYPSVNPSIIGNKEFAWPNEEAIIDAYQAQAASLYLQSENYRVESRTLATLRDELLPKLLSGDIRLN